MTKIKVCGLMTTEDIQAVNNAKPDLAGFIFAGGRHHISLDQALELRRQLDPAIDSVGVFVNAPIAEMIQAYDSGAVSIIQLHGQEDETMVAKLQAHGITVINVFKPTNIQPNTIADSIMLDSGSGNGKPVQWENFKLETTKPLIIAGALNIDNVSEAIHVIHPTLVDLSRGVETNGQKDPQKISEIVRLVHSI
ncbi:phosphoribosylanthranilate isomerase [Companilactobacillus sp.]|jgi:phosphoribosylanthranilate isomerase|uniref:phosphoribosylanthranilate isomerase n=1 Tax=Companilactobacillus sp. TaxID=2767905 RepID=UPI0025C41BE3|nr:phosphoribosylanthranilate isomerase [Companilactobacillus sp.]MCH4009034.1 phosphoribosylanthranilate isomerase [Companilactobacillus sp.]MCH4050787.1 phosphoribosylanthranilate isomerase [Companilactobacillus sp.]MCH4076976.1 phosphoribosylanthranilate isomerase [Companilactobacillus sp.]MCH4125552.1 phosphoribosylanthranilate isomerase [Companilactobacillus sp.]MCI1311261.1 phosphoribosylanthranilate isomerase [Companilactobacillus sp.]